MPSPPNILWLTLEDTSPRLGCYGDPLARTPHIDALAAAGRRYPLAFSTAAVCAPSRFAAITGMYATAMGAHQMRTGQRHPHAPELPVPYAVVPPPYVRTCTEYLRAAGYFCTNNAKTDYQFEPPCTAWDECGASAHWRHRAAAGQPFFAVFNLEVTHESGMWPRPDRPVRTDPGRVTLPPYLADTPKTREALARHYDNLETADLRVGELLAELDADGLAGDTAVFLWSDHGEGLPRGKRHPYDSGTRVPLIVRWPGSTPAGEVAADTLVSMIDLPVTALALAGVPLPRHLQGQPFLGPLAASRAYAFSAHDRHDEAADMVRAVRDRRYRYVRNFFPGTPRLWWNPYRNRHPAMQELWRLRAQGALSPAQAALLAPRPPEELYDTATDPHELHNLAAEDGYRDTLERLRGALEAWRSACGDLGDVPEEQLAARMWPGGVQPQTAAPLFIALGPDNPGIAPAPDGGSCAGPMVLQLYSATAGASIAYTLWSGPAARWRLYTEPLDVGPGRTTVRARAGRIGYADSPEVAATFAVGGVEEAGSGGCGAPGGEEAPELRARLAAFLQGWGEACAVRLRQGGHAGTDAELAALHAEDSVPADLARELRSNPGWAAAEVGAALGRLEPDALAAAVGTAVGLDACAAGGPAVAAVLSALRRAAAGEGL